VVEREESREEVSGDLYPDRWRRFWAASSAASFKDMADGFLRAVLKVKRARGANVARVSLNFSCNAFIACNQHYLPTNAVMEGRIYLGVGSLIVSGQVA
jgi:hypothetical protein